MSLITKTVAAIRPPDMEAARAAEQRLNNLTKPVGSLGRLEEIVRRYAAMRRDSSARTGRGAIAIFVADHGIAAAGVSAYPQAVTGEMLKNIAAGGAAISVLARRFGYALKVVDLGVILDTSTTPLEGVTYRRIGAGTRNFLNGPAMSTDETTAALETGIEIARELAESGATLIGIGEMGIGNSTPAAAILSAITGLTPELVVGRGTGLDDQGVRRKIEVVGRALELHKHALTTGESMLAAIGGFEFGAMAGVCLGGAALGVPVVVDGFIATAGAAIAQCMFPCVFEHLFFGHRSAEGGLSHVMEHLKVRPILDLDLRLGEGTGAALAMNVIESALDLFHNMATFVSAEISGKL
jgi:nicotinate-nucleotide--dimethylbenzimidazole phosphoribosyltransferase